MPSANAKAISADNPAIHQASMPKCTSKPPMQVVKVRNTHTKFSINLLAREHFGSSSPYGLLRTSISPGYFFNKKSYGFADAFRSNNAVILHQVNGLGRNIGNWLPYYFLTITVKEKHWGNAQ